jgi:hypothetical protein
MDSHRDADRHSYLDSYLDGELYPFGDADLFGHADGDGDLEPDF